jgi:hypothetical protein
MIPLYSRHWLPWAFTGLLAAVLPLTWSGTTTTPALPSRPSLPTRSSDDFERLVKPFLQEFCVRCHRGEDAEAGLDLSRFDNQEDVLEDLATWEEILQAIDDRYMPPAEEKQPKTDQIGQLKSWYARLASATGDADGGRVPPMRRLNRTEYENTIRDLLRMQGPVFVSPARILLVDDYFEPASGRMPRHVLAMSHFSYIQKRPPLLPGVPEVPTDPPVEHGFSNDHRSLSFSPLQTERYMELADAIVNAETFPRLSGLWHSLFLPRPRDQSPPDQKQTARERLQHFLGRAFRRPLTSREVDRYAGLFDHQLDQTGSHIEAMKATVSAILVSPSFLFRRDFSENSFDQTSVDPFALASRLSYFLWASMPDDELFAAAREGRLETRSDLLRQVRRMMRDKRIKSLATDFGMQWLQLASVHSAHPDRELFPEYYRNNSVTPGVSMMIEQLLFFETVMIENRDILEFVHADWGYLNRHLMDWYGQNPEEVLGFVPDPDMWEDFFRIRWSNKHKGGVISAGATMISTSATTRTSPVYRGAWVLDVIFNRPPPTPPANVPALEDIGDSPEQPLNVRQRLEQHRRDSACAVCHDRIDPVGFALEKFDAVGRFRQAYPNGMTVDARGTIFGEEYDGAARFKAVILRNGREFVQGFTEHMLKYALGRPLQMADEQEVGKIVDRVMERGHPFSAVVEEIVASDLFARPPRTGGRQVGQNP